MARKLPRMLVWMNEQISKKTHGKSMSKLERAKIWRNVAKEAKKKKKNGDFD